MKCPKCGLINLKTGIQCDCGYIFPNMNNNIKGENQCISTIKSLITRALIIISLCGIMFLLNFNTSLSLFTSKLIPFAILHCILWGIFLSIASKKVRYNWFVGIGAFSTSVIFLLLLMITDTARIINIGDIGRHEVIPELWKSHGSLLSWALDYLTYKFVWIRFHRGFCPTIGRKS